MDYKMEELLPIAAKLAKRYTSGESTSVSYNTARRLMEAVVYCIKECETENEAAMLAGQRVDSMTAYERGYRIALDKAEQAKIVYHQMIIDFEDYGCQNYRDTILKGIPAFFLKYDARFEPQNHILTLDYPVLELSDSVAGVDRVLDYLTEAEYEQTFLRNFDREAIMDLLEYVRPDYGGLYFDNLCIPVLIRAAACMISDEDVYSLKLDEIGEREAAVYFSEINPETARNRLGGLLDILEKEAMSETYRGIFRSCARDLAVRIQNGIRF
ncbi:DUF6179 domain-containing protein [Clostridium sp. C105KSO13]|uniref:DUF6179 domain-containing protein n=1 Tax=Clostridium sp. C105KSO13 TaxID=1776045 RepID=UPI0007406E17|nr:DUF6179 domain-containing protein [Clostridium sp. C105KSO13]CUX47398.1 hypothetical protein BN3456_02668 [Clostridium sp. C105KSO13]